MISSIFRFGPVGRLRRTLKRKQKANVRSGKYIVFTLRTSSSNKFYFRITIYRTPPHFRKGFTSGGLCIFESRKSDDFYQVLDSIMETVQGLSVTFPNLHFYRVVPIGSEELYRKYLLDFNGIRNKDAWLYDAIEKNDVQKRIKLTEQLIDGAWSPYIQHTYGLTYQYLSCNEIQFILEKSFTQYTCNIEILEAGWKLRMSITDYKDEVLLPPSDLLVSDINTLRSLYKFIGQINSEFDRRILQRVSYRSGHQYSECSTGYSVTC